MCLYLISYLVNYIVMSCFHYLDRSLEIKGGLLFTNKIIPDLFKDFSFSHPKRNTINSLWHSFV